MQRRPLAQDLGIGPRIGDLVGGGAGKMVGGDVADAVAGGLDGVHLDAGEVGEDGRHVRQRRPVELDVLARGEMAVAPVVVAGDVAEHAQLLRVQRAVGDGDAQHIGVQLQIDAVHQAQRLELVFGDLAGKAAVDLVAELARRGRSRNPDRTHRSGTSVLSFRACPPACFMRRGWRRAAPACRDRCGWSGRRRGCVRAAWSAIAPSTSSHVDQVRRRRPRCCRRRPCRSLRAAPRLRRRWRCPRRRCVSDQRPSAENQTASPSVRRLAVRTFIAHPPCAAGTA